jgi:hypothetical protein
VRTQVGRGERAQGRADARARGHGTWAPAGEGEMEEEMGRRWGTAQHHGEEREKTQVAGEQRGHKLHG